jgi:hypothetical protein
LGHNPRFFIFHSRRFHFSRTRSKTSALLQPSSARGAPEALAGVLASSITMARAARLPALI